MISISIAGEQADKDQLIAVMEGELLESEVRHAKQLLSTFIESNASQCKSIAVDVSGIKTVSSIVVAFLLSGLRAGKKYSCSVSYLNLPQYLYNMARVGGVEAILLGND